MAILSTIKDFMLYLKESTGYVLYRLSAKCVAMDNGNDLQTEIDTINNNLTGDYIRFPDYGTVIATYDNTGFTVTQNCWAKFEITSGWSNATVSINSNGVLIQQIKNTDSYPIRTSVMIPLKSGDVVTLSEQTSTNGLFVTLYAMR